MPRTRLRLHSLFLSAARAIAIRLWRRQRKTCRKAMGPGLALQWLLTPAPQPPLSFKVHESVHDVFARLETCVGPVYNRREEYVEQERREHAPLTKALFHSKPPQVHPIIEPHAWSHAIMESTNDRDNIWWHAETGGYYQGEGSVNGVLRFGIRTIKHTYNEIRFCRVNFCSPRITNMISGAERFRRKPLCSSGRIPMRS